MILYSASIVIFLFICFNLFFRTPVPLGWKFLGCALVFAASSKYLIYRFIGGSFFAPHLPREALICLEALYGAFIILFFLLLLWDIYLLGNFLLAKIGVPSPKKLPGGSIKCGLVILAIVLGCWGTWQSIKVPDAKTVTLEVPRLPKELDGITAAQVSDIHIGPILRGEWLRAVVDKTNALNPDLILLTGDYVDGYVDEIGQELAPLADLKAKYGIFAVYGNHEYYWNMPQWKRFIGAMGIDILENEHRQVVINGQTLVIAGLTDPAATRFGLPTPDISKALAGAPDVVKILLSHQPKFDGDYIKEADLVASGHTHGGLMFFIQPIVAKFNNGFVSGLYPADGKAIYVNPGSGLWSGFSCRLGTNGEITLFILKAKGN